jgi:O-6-methylguanine DNA methyltransferase
VWALRSTVRIVAAVATRYVVPGWGVGQLWRANGVVLAHDFDYRVVSNTEPDGGTDDLILRLRALLEGEETTFEDVVVDLEWATLFQRDLVDALRSVPRGEVVSYGELAALAGRPRAARAAGTFCAANRFALIVPCHRVVAVNGIGGYGAAGVDVKRRLLALEGVEL